MVWCTLAMALASPGEAMIGAVRDGSLMGSLGAMAAPWAALEMCSSVGRTSIST